MKLITYKSHRDDVQARTGVVWPDDRHLVDLVDLQVGKRDGADLRSMQSIIEAGDAALEEIRKLLAQRDRDAPADLKDIAEVYLCAPLPQPIKLRAFSVYERHITQSIDALLKARLGRWAVALNRVLKLVKPPKQFYQAPAYYKGNNTSFIGPQDELQPPTFEEPMLDFECELGLVIGKAGIDIPAEKALEHVFGYTVYNDVSARQRLIPEFRGVTGPLKGKDFETGNIMGPWIVTADEVADPSRLELSVSINGELMGQGRVADMHFPLPELIAHASEGERLVPGEFFGTGAPADCTGIEHWRFLKPGDLMELEIPGIGRLCNKVAGQA